MWKPASHPDFPWTGIVFGAPILGIWYWCTDQHIVQRVLAARNISEARTGTIFAGYLKILPVFIFVLPGIIAAALYSDVRGGGADSAYPVLVTRLLPAGFKGLVIAALIAAVMSSLSSVFNSCSTLVTWDVYRKLRPNASERRLVAVGRVATGLLVVLGLLWIPFMKYISPHLYIYLQSVQAYIAPPIAACFLFGVLSKRITGGAALITLLSGFVIGATRLGLELGKAHLTPGGVWAWIAGINFLHFAALLFVCSTVILFVASLAMTAPSMEHVADLTIQTAAVAPVAPEAARGRRLNIAASAALAAAIGVLWIVFR
jgi:SSS family solute:Na+ symporter